MVAFCGTVTPGKRSPIQLLPKLRMESFQSPRPLELRCSASSVRAGTRLLTEPLIEPPEPKV